MELLLAIPRRMLSEACTRSIRFRFGIKSPASRFFSSSAKNDPQQASSQKDNKVTEPEEEKVKGHAVTSSLKAAAVTKREPKGIKIVKYKEEDDRRRFERDDPPKEEERHEYWKQKADRQLNTSLMRVDLFENLKDKSKETFLMAIELFSQRDVHSRGHVEFIYSALHQMKHFGVHRDLEAYKKIIDVFPKGRMIATNMFQVEFMHYPKQQQCGIDVLEQMEEYGVCPDTETQQMLTNIFGSQSFPMRKASRMLYWMPKFKNLTPWPLPNPLPDHALELAKLAIQRISSVDLNTKITIYQTSELEGVVDDTWIVSGQSPDQQQLIETHPSDKPIYVEGAFRVWIQRTCINYFVLRAEPREIPKPKEPIDLDEVGNLSNIFEESFKEKGLAQLASVHEQDDGVILGLCATGNSSRDSVMNWIRFLEETNPRLGKDISVIFTLKSPIGPTDILEIPSIHEAQKVLGDREEFSSGSGGHLGLSPVNPSLKQVGVWSESESVFPNWPHHHHPPDSPSIKNLEANLRQLRLEEIQAKKSFKDAPQLEQPLKPD